MSFAPAALALFATPILLWSCARDAAVEAPSDTNLSVRVVPLATGFGDAAYGITVKNALGGVVWSRSDLRSSRYGNGAGALSYVGPCDASQNPHTIELTVENLFDGGEPLPAGSWVNPSKDGPLVKTATCAANADTPVDFNLTVMRAAQQGFIDASIDFSDVFCSAKADCVEELLHDPDDPDGARKTTLVVGFACTSGEGEATYLYLDDLVITCADSTRYVLDPSLGPGQVGGSPPMVFQHAIYRGREAFTNLEKCYWNNAIGIDVEALGPSCVLEATGSVSATPFVGGATPVDAIYPLIRWRIPLTTATPSLICEDHPLGGASGGVFAGYTTFAGHNFGHELACGSGVVTSPGEVACSGTVSGLDEDVSFTLAGSGLTVRAGSLEARYAFPDERRLGGCCLDPCCTEP